MPGTGTMPCWIKLWPFCRVSEYCSLSGSDLLKEVPSLLCSWPGSTRASTAVLSQIEPTPGAVIAAHAVPVDCGSLPPLVAFSDNSSDIVVGCRVTVISAPILVSQNGDSGCFTDTAEPFRLSLEDHDISAAVPACGETRAFDAGPLVNVDASTLSWLQSSCKSLMSASSPSGAAAVSPARISGFSPVVTLFACARAPLEPAARLPRNAQLYLSL